MDEPFFADVDFEAVLFRLVRYAQALLGVARLAGIPRTDVSLPGGDGPADLASNLLVRFLDPRDTTVIWKDASRRPTTTSVCAYLKKALRHDVLDLKKSAVAKTTDYRTVVATGDEDPMELSSLDDLPTAQCSPYDRLLRRENVDHVLAQFDSDPVAKELLCLQMSPDGYNAYSNQELAELLSITVAEVENSKKRANTRLLRILTESQRREVSDGKVTQ